MNLFCCLDCQSSPSPSYPSSPLLSPSYIQSPNSHLPQSSFPLSSCPVSFSSFFHSSLFPLTSLNTPSSRLKISSSPFASLPLSSSLPPNLSTLLPPSFRSLTAPKKPNSDKKRKKWTSQEDALVLLLIEKYGKMWAFIASFLEGRTGKQVRERYFNQLDPKIIKSKITAKEDEEIWRLYEQLGPKWLHISKNLPGRTENSIKNRYYSFLKKRF